MNKLEKMGAKIISQLTSDSEFGWPPDCYGFIYQPERPVQCKEAREEEKSSEDE